MAINKAMADVERKPTAPVPPHLRSTGHKGTRQLGNGVGYQYPHDFPNHYVKQAYLPEGYQNANYYVPTQMGYEKRLDAYLKYLRGGGEEK